MHRFKTQRGVFGLSTVLLLASLAGCNRNDPRLQRSIDALHWGGGSDNDRRIRDLLLAALEKATSESLVRPELVAATASLPRQKEKNGTLFIDWIGASPAADGVRILFSNGDVADFPFDPIEKQYNEHESIQLLVYHAVEFAQRDQPETWEKIIADPGAQAVLLKNTTIVSNRVSVVVLKHNPVATTTAEDSGKMIGTRDPDGHVWMYLLSHNVKAGDLFAATDVYRGVLNDETGLDTGKDGYLDLAGPSSFAGRRFLKSYSISDTLDTSMFAAPTTRPEKQAN